MSYTQNQVVDWFAHGKTNKNASNLYSEGNALYSYGRHFPLAVRHIAETSLRHEGNWYLLNGDKRSNTTTHHQQRTFGVFRDQPRVSFTALGAAGIDPFSEDLILIDFEEDHYLSNMISEDGMAAQYNSPNVSREEFRATVPFGALYSEAICRYASENGKPLMIQSIHRIGGALLQYKGECYLCALDEGSYFIAQLPMHVTSIAAAIESLKPPLVKYAEKEGVTAKRQGEWFFIPTPLKDKKEFVMGYNFRLPRPMDSRGNETGNIHTCAGGLPVTFREDKGYLCRGMIKHINLWGNSTHEHKPLRLGEAVYLAIRNTEKASWSGGGKVD